MSRNLLSVLIFLLFPFLVQGQLTFSINEITGRQIPRGGNDNAYKLRTEVYSAFLRMQQAAKESGIHIDIVSAYRNYDRQQYIWNKKFKKYLSKGLSKKEAANKIIEYSTYPGTSRHHWGTDIDIIQKVKNVPKQLLVAKNFEAEGAFCVLHEWMQNNASKYGFYLVYTNDKKRTGFSYEPWHYSYRTTSVEMLKVALELHVYEEMLKKEQNPLDINYFFTHILGINSLLKP